MANKQVIVNGIGTAHEKVGEDFEQVHESYRRFHPAFVEKWQFMLTEGYIS